MLRLGACIYSKAKRSNLLPKIRSFLASLLCHISPNPDVYMACGNTGGTLSGTYKLIHD